MAQSLHDLRNCISIYIVDNLMFAPKRVSLLDLLGLIMGNWEQNYYIKNQNRDSVVNSACAHLHVPMEYGMNEWSANWIVDFDDEIVNKYRILHVVLKQFHSFIYTEHSFVFGIHVAPT